MPPASRRSTANFGAGSKASTITPHTGLDQQTLLERWAQAADLVRFPEPDLDLEELFLFEAARKVQKDRTVSLNGVIYEVDAALVGQRVTLRYDPAEPGKA